MNNLVNTIKNFFLLILLALVCYLIYHFVPELKEILLSVMIPLFVGVLSVWISYEIRTRSKKPRLFWGRTLSLQRIKRGAEILNHVIDCVRFNPDMVVALNQGGMIVAATLCRHIKKPIGIIQTHRPGDRTAIQFYSLPDIQSVNTILVVDAKFKSGRSAMAAKEKLLEKYGNITIRFGVVLAYVGGNRALRKSIKNNLRSYVGLKEGGNRLEGYAAYFKNINPAEKDTIWEEVRHG